MTGQNPDSVRPPLDEHDWAFYGEAFVLADAVRRFLARRQTQLVIDAKLLDDDVVRHLTESADRIWLIRTQRIAAARAKARSTFDCARTPSTDASTRTEEEIKMSDDAVDAVIAAYMNHLEGGGPAPSLDDLTAEERREARELMDLIDDARGVDFYRSPPPLEVALADTELAHELIRRAAVSAPMCHDCGQAHASLFCPPQRVQTTYADPNVCTHPLPWEAIGRCTYCSSCMSRLYQGTPPKDEESRTAMVGFLRKIGVLPAQNDGSADGAS